MTVKISASEKKKLKAAFNPDLHPRYPAGHPMGGKFMPKESADYKKAIAEVALNSLAKKVYVSPEELRYAYRNQEAFQSLYPSFGEFSAAFKEKKQKKSEEKIKKIIEQERAIQKILDSGEFVYEYDDGVAPLDRRKLDNLRSPMDGSNYGVRGVTSEKAAMLASSLTGVTKERGEQMAHSIEAFTYRHDQRIRKAQREGKDYDLVNDPDGTKNDHKVDYSVIDALNEYLDKAPKYKGVIHRGLKFTSKEEGERFIKELQAAGGYTQREHSSFSSEKSVADRFADVGLLPITVVMSVPNKSAVGIKRFSHFPSESEVLSPSGAKYKVKSIKKESRQERDHYNVELEEIESELVATRREALKRTASSPEAVKQREFRKSERMKKAEEFAQKQEKDQEYANLPEREKKYQDKISRIKKFLKSLALQP